jgi:hypothetical protein
VGKETTESEVAPLAGGSQIAPAGIFSCYAKPAFSWPFEANKGPFISIKVANSGILGAKSPHRRTVSRFKLPPTAFSAAPGVPAALILCAQKLTQSDKLENPCK